MTGGLEDNLSFLQLWTVFAFGQRRVTRVQVAFDLHLRRAQGTLSFVRVFHRQPIATFSLLAPGVGTGFFRHGRPILTHLCRGGRLSDPFPAFPLPLGDPVETRGQELACRRGLPCEGLPGVLCCQFTLGL